jgi:hypothetical protein
MVDTVGQGCEHIGPSTADPRYMERSQHMAVQGHVGHACVAYWGSVDSYSASRARWGSCAIL